VQLLIFGTFIGVLAITLGLYWLFVIRDEDRSSAQIRKRLRRTVGTVAARRLELAKQEQHLSTVGSLNRLLTRATSISAPLEKLIEQADSHLTVGKFLLLSGMLSTGVCLLVTFVSGFRGLGLLAGALVVWGPYLYLRWKRNKRMLQFEEKFPEAIDLIARALRAGHAFATGLGMVADEMPDPIGTEFRLLYDRQNFGMPLQDALRAFAERIPLLDARFFATAVLTQREAGGNLSEVLDNLAKVVRERFKVKRQIRVVSAHARMTGWALVALPPITAVGMLAVSPENTKLLITDPIGINMVIAAVILQVTGGLIVKKLVAIEY
jgi:tight adherence protein B